MDDANYQFLRMRIDAVLAEKRLTAWQRGFLTDIRNKIDKYGNRTRLTKKQLQKLAEIVGEANVVPFRPRTNKTPFAAHVRWQPRKRSFFEREARWWSRRIVRDFSFAVAFFAVILVFSFLEKMPNLSLKLPFFASQSATADGQRFSVTDGDTVHVDGESAGTRLVGFNTPEVFSPRCERERQLGERASARLKELVASSSLSLTKIACSCAPGTEGTDECNHGRSCGRLEVDGRDVGDILISEGLAVSFTCGSTSCPPTPRPWCG
ncbi:micrococcal nuclease [Sinorhizobium fredii]